MGRWGYINNNNNNQHRFAINNVKPNLSIVGTSSPVRKFYLNNLGTKCPDRHQVLSVDECKVAWDELKPTIPLLVFVGNVNDVSRPTGCFKFFFTLMWNTVASDNHHSSAQSVCRSRVFIVVANSFYRYSVRAKIIP